MLSCTNRRKCPRAKDHDPFPVKHEGKGSETEEVMQLNWREKQEKEIHHKHTQRITQVICVFYCKCAQPVWNKRLHGSCCFTESLTWLHKGWCHVVLAHHCCGEGWKKRGMNEGESPRWEWLRAFPLILMRRAGEALQARDGQDENDFHCRLWVKSKADGKHG